MPEITLESLIQSAIQDWTLNLDICMPVQIDSFNSDELLAVVTPSFDTEFADGSIIGAPKISGVPVCFPMTSNRAIIFPLEKGDQGVIVCSQRNLDTWKSGLAERELKDSNMFQLSNAFLIPGVSHISMVSKHLARPKDAMCILSDKLFLGDPNAIVNPLLATKGLKQRDLIGILKVMVDLLASVQYGGTSSPAPFGGVDPTALSTLQAIGKELEELLAK